MSPPPGEGAPPRRFAADAMLGRLARWLRALGYDTTYEEGIHDVELARRARDEGRVLLTRDRRLPRERHVPEYLVLEGDDPLEQLRAVVARFGLATGGELFTRCLLCNALLRPATAEEAGRLVPESLRGRAGPVRRCPRCGRVYWEGSHTRRMRDALARALGAGGTADGAE